VPIPEGLGSVGIQFEEFGTRMHFLPIVLGNGKVHLEVEVELSEPSSGGATQRAHTAVELERGQTFVMRPFSQPRTGDRTGQKAADTGACGEGEADLIVLVTPRVLGRESAEQRLLPPKSPERKAFAP
jgi:pilus assembly protein CpaC